MSEELESALNDLAAAVDFRCKITAASKAGEDTIGTGAFRDAMEWLQSSTLRVAEAWAKEPTPASWPCSCDEFGIGEPGVTCGDCPRDYYQAMLNAAPPAPAAQASDGMPSSKDERYLRRLLAYRVNMPQAYYDDGEAQGAQHGISIDFMRDPVADIDAKLCALNVARAECADEPPLAQQGLQAPLSEAGWTDADADAARLALELECLLSDKDVPMPALSRWWDSAHEALKLHRERMAGITAPRGQEGEHD